jgi:hypothetical protein
MVYSRISEKLGFAARHLRWASHRRSDDQKATHVHCFQTILVIPHIQQVSAWHEIMILDESWFYFIPDHELIWLLTGGKVPDRERVTIQSNE